MIPTSELGVYSYNYFSADGFVLLDSSLWGPSVTNDTAGICKISLMIWGHVWDPGFICMVTNRVSQSIIHALVVCKMIIHGTPKDKTLIVFVANTTCWLIYKIFKIREVINRIVHLTSRHEVYIPNIFLRGCFANSSNP